MKEEDKQVFLVVMHSGWAIAHVDVLKCENEQGAWMKFSRIHTLPERSKKHCSFYNLDDILKVVNKKSFWCFWK